jgi:hypothetical protein
MRSNGHLTDLVVVFPKHDLFSSQHQQIPYPVLEKMEVASLSVAEQGRK